MMTMGPNVPSHEGGHMPELPLDPSGGKIALQIASLAGSFLPSFPGWDNKVDTHTHK